MANIVNPSILPGFLELLPKEQKSFDKLKGIIEDNFIKYGFVNLDTPLIEKEEILLSKGGGETAKQIYRIDKESTPQALRFDLTVSLARYVAMHAHELAFPFRRYQIGKVYRGERNQKGRFREFYQCDIDILGQDTLSIINDAEIPLVIYNIFKDIGFEDMVFHINNRRLLNGFFEAIGVTDTEGVLRTIDKILKIGKENTENELRKLGLDDEQITKVFDLIEDSEDNDSVLRKLEDLHFENEEFLSGKNDLIEVYNYMVEFGIPVRNIKLDLSITRGLDYYTGTVFETFLTGYESIGSVCSGGRYDDLANNFTKQKFPGIGLSIGLTRLYYQLNEIGLLKSEDNSYCQVVALPMSEDEIGYCFKLVSQLRNEGIASQVYFEKGKFKKKFTYADKINARYALVVGEDERANEQVSVRDLKSGNQDTIAKADLIEYLKR
ncbi:MAG: histidine--tRNA ligase [Tissierellia bacterium]|nr:histidine--tRNA ligase [Tissierellia bacterium]